MKKIIHSQAAPSPIGPYSQAVWGGDTLYISGQIALDPSSGELKTQNIQDETHWVMKHLGSILKEAGLDYVNLVKCSIFIKDMNQFTEINEVYGSYFKEMPPARETVEVAALPKGVNVEISAMAIR